MQMKETTELVLFAVALGNGLGKSLEDKTVSLGDAINFFEAMKAAGPAFADMQKIPAELADMDEAEKKALSDLVVEKFNIPQDGVEAMIEKALKSMFVLADLVTDFMPKKAEA